jgi:uncharacterized membrane protein YdjX (TVP38/TMEM64 family)
MKAARGRTRSNGRFIFKMLLLFGFAVLGVYLFIYFDLHFFFIDRTRAIHFIKSFHPFDEVAFIVLQVLQVVAAPIPGEATGLIGGYLYDPILGTIYSTIGLTVGSWIAFMLARIFGMPFVEKVVKPKVIAKYDHFLEHQGTFVSFLLFLIPGFPKDCLCYIMGVSHMPTRTFIIISTIGRLLGTMLLSVSGSYARNDKYMALVGIMLVSGIFVILAFIYRDGLLTLLKKNKKAEQSHSTPVSPSDDGEVRKPPRHPNGC